MWDLLIHCSAVEMSLRKRLRGRAGSCDPALFFLFFFSLMAAFECDRSSMHVEKADNYAVLSDGREL